MLARVYVAMVGFLFHLTFSIRTAPPRAEQAQDQSHTHGHDQDERARVLMYHILLTDNEKHTADQYAEGLRTQCESLQHEVDNGRLAAVSVFGSVGWVAESAPSCAPFVFAGGRELSETDLPDLEGGHLWTNCSLKYNHGPSPFPQFGRLVNIWLNKLLVTCVAAEKHPNEVTMFIDSNLYKRPEIWELAMKVPSKLLPGRLGMQNRMDVQTKRPTWFGQDQCTTPPRVRAKYIAVRGKDCPRLVDEYLDSRTEVIADSTCGCWDEEMIFAKMYSKNPDLFDTGE